jgi:dTDP-4-amino-4,6-dideoxygalactose transaminase
MEWKIPLADLDYGPEEEQAVLSVLRSKWLTMGAVTQQFEQAFASYHKADHAIAVSNATQALHLACLALGIGPGDEVIVPSLSFVATSNAVLYTGATVRFADIIGPDELTIDPESVECLITPRTKAVIVMHYAGYPCRMAELLTLARRYSLFIIEDAAHSPGAWLGGRALGTWGNVGCFSFFSNKNLSTGEGGMLVTSYPDMANRLRLLRSHGMTSLTYDRHQGRAYSYDVVELGYNNRIDEMHSALGLVQLAKLKNNNTRRQTLTDLYRKKLTPLGLTVPFGSTPGTSACHILPMLLPEGANRSAFMEKMKAAGIQTSIHYPPIHNFAYYRKTIGRSWLPVTETVAAREVTLPLYPEMGEEGVNMVVAAIEQAMAVKAAG